LRTDKENLDRILAVLSKKSGVDLLNYKHTTLQRRISRRLHILNLQSLADYYDLLVYNEAEQHQLYKEMLIHVSSFFRDEKSFDFLCSDVIPSLLKDKQADETVRVWVCGCSTGEEAYSIAICLHEHHELIGNLSNIKIFASDVSENAIAKARQGTYSEQTVAKMAQPRLEKYFTKVKDGYRIKAFIRDMCVFAVQNVLADPPFAKIDLLSCRNVLIYMQPVLQRKVLATFSYAIKPGGFLFLGKSETSGLSGRFESVNKSANIFVNRTPITTLHHQSEDTRKKNTLSNHFGLSKNMDKKDFQTAADDMLLQKYVPVGVVINDSFDIVDFRGNTGFFIEPSPGIASFNVLKMVRKGLYYDLNEALNKVKAERSPVKRENIALEHEGRLLRITLDVLPLAGTKEKFYLILFQTIQSMATAAVSEDGINDARDLRILQLEQELVQSRDQLRALSEEQEATNEEFQSANEELKSLNEELQTSQEEVISINEELLIRNKELSHLNDQLTRANEYTESINNTITDALVVLDHNLRVRSANTSFYEKFEVLPGEVEGKVLYELGNGQWDIMDLRRQLEEILPRKRSFNEFIVTHDFPSLGKRVMKLNAQQIRSRDKGDSLILLVINDVTELTVANDRIKEKQEQIYINEERQRLAIDATHYGVWDYEIKTNILYLSKETRDILGQEKLSLQGWESLLERVVEDDIDRIKSAIRVAVKGGHAGLFAEEYRIRIPETQTVRWVSNHGKAMFDEHNQIKRLTGVVADITERKTGEVRLQEAIVRLNLALHAGQIGSWELRLDDRKLGTSKQCKANYGLPDDAELTYDSLLELVLPDDKSTLREAIDAAVATKGPFHAEYRVKWPDDSIHWMEASGLAQLGDDGEVINLIGVTTDISERKEASEKLEYSEHHFRTLANSSPVMVGMCDLTGNFYFFNKLWQKFIGASDTGMRGAKWSNFMHPDDLESFMVMQDAAAKKNSRFQKDIRLRTMGKYRWVSCIAEPRFGLDNKFLGYTMACTDIHDQKTLNEELERKIEERTGALKDLNDDLQDRNQELKQFAYVTSHDLQEPLRKIKVFAGMLLARESKENMYLMEYLQKIEYSASRMIGLIHDLLNYSSIQDRVTSFTPVQLSKIIQNVIADFDLLIQEKEAVISLGTVPVIDAVPSQMNQLFYNLVGNALKFSRDGARPEISITSGNLTQEDIEQHELDPAQNYVRITIADNGIGFDPGFGDRIFEIFQRLHDRETYTGNGIGLALCKRIVTNHGGLIKPFSEEGKGSRFEVILPEKHI
jgi:two-component system CheB/CheR fusion protein